MARRQETIDYFELMEQVAESVVNLCPLDKNINSYLRQRVQVAWHELNTHLSAGWPLLAGQGNTAMREHTNKLCSDLAREALIVAWYYGIHLAPGGVSVPGLADQATDAATTSKVRI